MNPTILHRGARNGVTGSCHQLFVEGDNSLLVDCGLFQGTETAPDGKAGADRLDIDFPVAGIGALILTHVHIDHCGRLPWLLAAGFKGPILCSEPSARLLPTVLADAFQVGVSRNKAMVERYLDMVEPRIRALPYGKWHTVYRSAGADLPHPPAARRAHPRLGLCGMRTLRPGLARKAPCHLFRRPRRAARALAAGAAFAVAGGRARARDHLRRPQARRPPQPAQAPAGRGRTRARGRRHGDHPGLQHRPHPGAAVRVRGHPAHPAPAPRQARRQVGQLKIFLDSPLAQRFTELYRELQPFWDDEARARVRAGRQPLSYEQLVAIDTHDRHLANVQRLARSREPAIVIAASGMCAGGRVVNYLKAMLGDPRHDVLFVGYRRAARPVNAIQTYGPRGGYVDIDDERIEIRAGVHSMSGYSAHADQEDLTRFVTRMRHLPGEVRLVHGEDEVRAAFARHLQAATEGKVNVVP
jgi:Predicted metal-dependent RNase, consists of a metallo-beta-lactamase domain and an RNA-binding KH domain